MISDDTSTISHVFGLAVLDNILLYSDWDTNTITMVDMASDFRTSLVSNLTRPTAIVLYQPDKLDGKNLLSLVVRKPAFCICENKDADQLRVNREADQHLCFRYMDSTIPLLP